MTIDNIRLTNARALAETLAKGRGQQAKFADLVGITRQLTNNYIGPNPTKRIGDEMARTIEEAFDRRRGWLDERHDDDVTSLVGDVVEVRALDVHAVLGAGRPADFPVRQINVSRAWARDHLRGVVADQLATASTAGAAGDVLPPESTVLIDCGATALRRDGVYLLGQRRGTSAAVWCRNVRRQLDGRFSIVDSAGETVQVEKMAELGLVVLGRVLAVLEIRLL
jgi:hypothetical protein